MVSCAKTAGWGLFCSADTPHFLLVSNRAAHAPCVRRRGARVFVHAMMVSSIFTFLRTDVLGLRSIVRRVQSITRSIEN